MHFRVSSSFTAVASVVLVLHFTCFARNITAQKLSLFPSGQHNNVNPLIQAELTLPDAPLNLNGAQITAKLPNPDISLDLNGASIAGKLPQPEATVNLNGASITGKLPQPDISLDLNGASIAGKLPQPEASLNLNGASITGKLPQPDISLDLNGASIAGKLSQPEASLNLNGASITGKLPQPDISLDLSGASIAGKLPQPEASLNLNGASITGNIPKPDISLSLNGASINGNLPRPEASLNLNGASITGKLPQPNISVGVNGISISEKLPQPEVSLDVNNEPIMVTLIPDDFSLDLNGTSVSDNNPTQVSYDVQDSVSSTENVQPEVSSSATAQVTATQWVQKIHKSKSLKPPAQTTTSTTVEYSGTPMLLGQTIANILYGAPWSSSLTSPKCSEDMKLYNSHKQKSTLWAVKMLDATSKGPEGILDGNTHSFGNFDQCLSTKSKYLGISGGYSLVDLDFRPIMQLYPEYYDNDHSKDYDPLDDDASAWEGIKHNIQEDYIQRHKFQWAVCLPDTCESEDVQKIISNVLVPELNRHGLEANVTIDPLLHTSNKNLYQYTAGFYFVCALYVAVTMLVFSGTLYDFVYLQYRPKSEHGPMKKFMKPFSLISNIERLLKPSESEEFSIINGLKVCAILQVIVGHRWFLEFGNPQMNPNFTHWVIHNFWFGYFKCSIFLETFFVISGFLTFHLITKQLVEKKTLNFVPIMIYRWLRIFPVYGALIVTYIFVLPYLNDGPYWRKIIYRESERCQANWWTNVLYINNYVHTDELCIIPSWYLTCDMHFFIVGTLLTYTIWKWRKPGLVLLGTCLTLSTIIPAYIIMNEQHRGTPAIDPENLQDLSKDRFYTKVYIKSHMRAMTYFIGILAGYVYMQLKEADYKLSLKSRIFWVPVVLLTGNLIYLSSGIFFVTGHTYVDYEHAIYFTVGRLVWSILISYGIIGHGLSGFGVCISGFLGHRIFHVLGKLVFCIYMFQEISQLQTISSMKTPTYQNMTMMTWRFCGDVLNALMYAFAINIMVESPFDRLQKNVMKIFVGDAFSKPKPQLSNNDNTTNQTRKFTV